jgi:hypothetical protein
MIGGCHLEWHATKTPWIEGETSTGLPVCWRWISVNLAMSLPSVLAWILYLIHWY